MPALAEDEGRGVGYVAEGPVFDLPIGMSVEQQEVHVTLHSVRLIYVFKSPTHQIVHFSFAMPGMPVDASPDAIGLGGGAEAAGLAADRLPLNYLNLSVRVNGTPLVLAGHGQALFDGKDVTRQLLDANVPLIYDLDGEAPWRRLPPETQAMLKASGLLDADAAQWSFQANFEWNQSFEPGETRIEVSYTPVANYWSDITLDHFPEIAPGGSATRVYCIDDTLRRAFFRKPTYELYTVTHGVAPSGGWRGPVGHYRLVVGKDAVANLVAFCPVAAKRISPTAFEWTAKDFTPGSEIGVLFFVDPAAASSSEQERP
jgi:hypothetical protein